MTLKTVLLIGFIGAFIGCSNNPEGADPSVDNVQPDRAATPAAAVPAMPADATPRSNDTDAELDPTAGSAVASMHTATPTTAEECARRGGTWRKAGLMKLDVCDLPMADAGKPCQNDSECESVCVAAEGAAQSDQLTGECYRSNITVGTCLTLVDGGRIAQAQCAD